MTGHEARPSVGEVTLRDVTKGDLSVLFKHQLDPEANRMAAFPARSRDAFMVHWERILDDETVTTKTVLVDGKVAGSVVSFEQDGKLEVGYWLGRGYWDKGIATAALSAFVELVRVRPLYAHVAKHNVASIRVLENSGSRSPARRTGPPTSQAKRPRALSWPFGPRAAKRDNPATPLRNAQLPTAVPSPRSPSTD